MTKIMLTTITAFILFAMGPPSTSAGAAPVDIEVPAMHIATNVDYWVHGHHWRHRAKSHGHWHYWN
jgi:hypothetical protein